MITMAEPVLFAPTAKACWERRDQPKDDWRDKCWFGESAEDCTCGRCGPRYQVEAFYLDVEVKETVSCDDLERKLEESVKDAMVSYDDKGICLTLCGLYRQLCPGKGLYSVLVTTAAYCVAHRLVRGLADGLRHLQPDGAAEAVVDIAGYGPSGDPVVESLFCFWAGQCLHKAWLVFLSDDCTRFSSREAHLTNLGLSPIS